MKVVWRFAAGFSFLKIFIFFKGCIVQILSGCWVTVPSSHTITRANYLYLTQYSLARVFDRLCILNASLKLTVFSTYDDFCYYVSTSQVEGHLKKDHLRLVMFDFLVSTQNILCFWVVTSRGRIVKLGFESSNPPPFFSPNQDSQVFLSLNWVLALGMLSEGSRRLASS